MLLTQQYVIPHNFREQLLSDVISLSLFAAMLELQTMVPTEELLILTFCISRNAILIVSFLVVH